MSVELINLQACKMLLDLLVLIVLVFLVTFIVGTLFIKMYDSKLSQRDGQVD